MRRRKAEKRKEYLDPKYNSPIVGKLIKLIMLEGKNSIAQRIVYNALDKIGEIMQEDPFKVFLTAIDNARPRLEVRPRRIGGATYQIPMEVPEDRSIAIVLRWFRDFARQKKGKPMVEKLANEIILAYKGEGAVVKKKEDTHKMAEANRAFAHFRL